MNILFGIIIIIVGIFNISKPEKAWYLSEGWKFRDAEPSDLAIFFIRVVGFVAIVGGLIVMLAG